MRKEEEDILVLRMGFCFLFCLLAGIPEIAPLCGSMCQRRAVVDALLPSHKAYGVETVPKVASIQGRYSCLGDFLLLNNYELFL